MQIIKGKISKPRRILIYGPHGIGKSTFGAMAPKPIFLPTEEGANDIDVDKFPQIGNFLDWSRAISHLLTAEHEYETAVVDSLDWLQPIVCEQTCFKHGKPDIESFGYGKGYTYAEDTWRTEVYEKLDELRNTRGMNIILVAHAVAKKYNDPTSDPYDRYGVDLREAYAAMSVEWCDEVFFANYKTFVRSVDEGFNKKTTKGVGDGERVIYTQERPAFTAKNRLNLPPELALDYRAYAAYLPGSNGNGKELIASAKEN